MQTYQEIPPTSEDSELIARFTARGDDTAFTEIVRRHLPLVLAVTRRRLGGSGLAEDAAQQVFIALFRRLKQHREIPCLAAWLQKAAVYEAANLARKEDRHRRRMSQAQDLQDATEPANDGRQLDRALASLPERDRQILLLHHFEKLSFAKVATRLGISEAAAQRRGHRALEKLGKFLRSQGVGRDSNACSMWLAASLAPANTPASPDLIAKVSAVKHAAVHALPWLPVAAVLTFVGGTWATMEIIRPAPPTVTTMAAAAPSPPRERPRTRPFAPQSKDEDLGDDVREFISRAKVDSHAAWDWVKLRPEGAVSFLSKRSVRALADRDLPAAERFFAVIEGLEARGKVISGIFGSRASGDFKSAVVWVDSVEDLRGVHFIECNYINSEYMDYDYAATLGLARQPKVREWLIRQACEKSAALDETGIEKLAASLKGNERQIALGFAASLLLQRGDPRAYDVLAELKEDLWNVPDIDKVALRDPHGLLDWLANQDDAQNRDKIASTLWHIWSEQDANSALAWAEALSPGTRDALDILRFNQATDDVVSRLLKQP